MTVIEKIKNLKFYNLISDLKEILLYGNRPYKVYTAILTQEGADAPTAIVLENTFGSDFTFEYVGEGAYKVKNSNIKVNSYVLTSTNLQVVSSGTNAILSSNSVSNEGEVLIYTLADGGKSNDVLYKAPIEIRVY